MRAICKTKGDHVTDVIIILLLVILGLLALYPLWFVIIASFSDPTAVNNGEVLFWPKDITFDAYKNLAEKKDIWIGYRNSILYLFGGTGYMLLITLPAAYALSRKELKGRRVLNFLFIICMYFGGGIIPTYLLHNSIGWLNTPWVLIVPAGLNVYYMILARSAFSSLPESLREAAIVDGASELHYFVRFAVPLTKATIAVLFLFGALGWWNEYLRFLIYIDDPNLQSLQVVIRDITSNLSSSFTEIASSEQLAAELRQRELLKYSVVVIAALPFCLLYPFVQKFFNRGVMIGAIKG